MIEKRAIQKVGCHYYVMLQHPSRFFAGVQAPLSFISSIRLSLLLYFRRGNFHDRPSHAAAASPQGSRSRYKIFQRQLFGLRLICACVCLFAGRVVEKSDVRMICSRGETALLSACAPHCMRQVTLGANRTSSSAVANSIHAKHDSPSPSGSKSRRFPVFCGCVL